MAGSSEPAFYLGAKKGAIAQSPIYFLVILRQPLLLFLNTYVLQTTLAVIIVLLSYDLDLHAFFSKFCTYTELCA